MFSPSAWSRLALASFLLTAPLADAREQSLFTSSVTYCAPPESLLVERFDLAYFQANESVVFNIVVASVDSNTSVNANLLLNVYGMQPLDLTIDICSLFGGALCPLPVYTFNGSDTISLPDSLDVSSQIPGIAYVIPDLEAFAQLNLTDVKTGEVKACLQTTLSNGWSTHQSAVEWATASIALFALVLAIYHSVVDPDTSLLPTRFLDVMSLFQSIALSGLLSLNYPTLYRSFTFNFAWTVGLFTMSSSSPIQLAINQMRHSTGGSLSNVSSDGAISFVNRQLSPYNVGQSNFVLGGQSLVKTAPSLPQIDLAQMSLNTTGLHSQVLSSVEVATVTEDSTDVLQAGIPIFTNTLGIATANAFMTIFLIFLILVAIVIASLGLAYGISLALSRSKLAEKRPDIMEFHARFPSFAKAWCLRIAMVSLLPITVFAFYQWTLKDSWLSVLLSVIALLALAGFVLYATFFAIRASLPNARWTNETPSLFVAPFTSPYRSNRVYYVGPVLTTVLVKALVTAFGSTHGMAQAVIFVISEFFLFLSIIVMKPHHTRGSDVLAGYLTISRLVCSGLMLAFTETLSVKAIPRVAIGAIIAVIYSVAVIVLFLNLLVHLGLWRLIIFVCTCGRRGRTAAHRSLASHTGSSVEEKDAESPVTEKKNSVTITTTPSQYIVARPENPSPPSTESFSHYAPQSATSSTTLGETLPRRWSFQHSRPPSVSTDAMHSPAYTHRTSTASSPISAQRHSRNISSSLPTPLEEHPEHEAHAL
ncbi:TRP-domain-containing protein [Epithele typhae]|uniref:TRP-domain-containing protein n=1 Tax=Epithele typhae TaxID=378194 RepID=UPI002007621F|nr:TRP-domain-containing protein [Epithele typhae]KAH9942245.1 TRP-domain-containing protein [Epithele typhae]